jgi:amino acid transporter
VAKSWTDDAPSPKALKEHAHLRDPLSYRIKRFLLGAPLNRHTLSEQRLSKRNAFGILSSDCISSSAYGGEQILVALIPAFGLMAFSLFTPMLAVILFMLFVIALSYRDVINTYTRAGGAYVVARENFGVNVSLVAAIELMFGYIITVAIQTAAGVAAVISAFPSLSSQKVIITVAVIALLTFINLRGVKDAGVIFVFPSYLFIASMLVVFGMGLFRTINGTLPQYATDTPGLLPLGEEQGLLSFAALLMILKAFANGSASLTGLEAVSDSVPLFKSPEHVNARRTFTVMAFTLAFLVIGIGWLAYETTTVPYAEGTPTVISLVAKAALGDSLIPSILYLVVQAGTMLILFAGANTCYSAFPNMVRIVANDGYLPKWLTSRGHRLAFSNGILFIAIFASVLVVISGASITTLAAIYALTVFMGFTITGMGMAKKVRREHAGKNRYALHILSGSISLITVLVLALAKFVDGTWLVVIGTPIALILMRNFNSRYNMEQDALVVTSEDRRATSIPRHDVTVLVDKVDVATIATVRYARSLKPRQLHAVHFVLDDRRAERIAQQWNKNPALADVPIELIDCPDRRLPNAAVDYAIRTTLQPDVELTLLLPRRLYRGVLGRLLHDETAEQIARPISELPRVVATIVPIDVNRLVTRKGELPSALPEKKLVTQPVPARAQSTWQKGDSKVSHYQENEMSIGNIQWRERANVTGKVTAIRPASMNAAPTLEVEIWDETGGVTLQFLGRREIAGLEVGSTLSAEGMVGEQGGALTILNPSYEIKI